jgi:hypothetical protein
MIFDCSTITPINEFVATIEMFKTLEGREPTRWGIGELINEVKHQQETDDD